ncbi:hypothetical protein E2C01_032359 [Portunus trituberculatus]|uniref:Uncharacterized protein n=1 Tax=Portunus trituberculatus TaxID=210409 RepID=A0A5B7F155_PORTR|nr:hypothetical protein [Portunus trituberculatus]
MDDILNDHNTRVYLLPSLTTPAADTNHTHLLAPRPGWERDAAIKLPTTSDAHRQGAVLPECKLEPRAFPALDYCVRGGHFVMEV